MKKIIIFCTLLMIGIVAQAADLDTTTPAKENIEKTITLTGGLVFDWLDISQVKRDQVIDYYRGILFDENTVFKYNKKAFREEYKDHLKDPKFKEHYMQVKDGIKETPTENLCGFYYRDNLLISYAIQFKSDLKTVYYYDTYGSLRYIDKFSDNYPSFPYEVKQYRANGSLVSAIYFMSHDMQYMYESDKKFKGAWYKERMYDRNAKQVLTRTNW